MDVELAGDLRDAVGLAAGEPDRLAPKVLRVRRASSFLAHGAPPASNLLRGAGGVHQTGGGPKSALDRPPGRSAVIRRIRLIRTPFPSPRAGEQNGATTRG